MCTAENVSGRYCGTDRYREGGGGGRLGRRDTMHGKTIGFETVGRILDICSWRPADPDEELVGDPSCWICFLAAPLAPSIELIWKDAISGGMTV